MAAEKTVGSQPCPLFLDKRLFNYFLLLRSDLHQPPPAELCVLIRLSDRPLQAGHLGNANYKASCSGSSPGYTRWQCGLSTETGVWAFKRLKDKSLTRSFEFL